MFGLLGNACGVAFLCRNMRNPSSNIKTAIKRLVDYKKPTENKTKMSKPTKQDIANKK